MYFFAFSVPSNQQEEEEKSIISCFSFFSSSFFYFPKGLEVCLFIASKKEKKKVGSLNVVALKQR